MLEAGTTSAPPIGTPPPSRSREGNRPGIVLPPAADGTGDLGIGRERSAYRPSTRARPVAMIVSALLVGSLVTALALVNVVPAAEARHDPVMMDLAVTPPPPPPHQPPVPHSHHDRIAPRRPPIVAPVPIVAVPAVPVVATAPQPDPLPVVPPRPAPAAPAPTPAAAPAVASAGDLSSNMISAKPPVYPLESRRRHEQGTVVLKLLLGTDGQVSDVSLERSSGSDRLDQAALAAVRKWRWKPVIRNGEAVLVQGLVTIPFVLTH